MADDAAVRPCRVCGRSPRIVRIDNVKPKWLVRCSKRGQRQMHTCAVLFATRERAIEEWNYMYGAARGKGCQ